MFFKSQKIFAVESEEIENEEVFVIAKNLCERFVQISDLKIPTVGVLLGKRKVI